MVKLDAPDAKISPRNAAASSLEWRLSDTPVDYVQAVTWMESRVDAIRSGQAAECVWLLEHPPVYTAGTSADRSDLVEPDRLPVIQTGRGGQFTYHGPGQRVAYMMLDLTRRGRDVRSFVCSLEDWIIDTLSEFGIRGERRAGRVGVWVADDKDGVVRESKIAAIGVRVRRWVTFHGMSLNVSPDLSHYDGIIPCGIRKHGVTSLAKLGKAVTMEDVDRVLRATFERHFPNS